MRIDYSCGAETLAFVSAEIDEHFSQDCARGVGIRSDAGQLVAGWVWHNYSPDAGTIEFSGAATTAKWMTRAILQELFDYAFSFSQMVVTRNAADNKRLHRQLKAFGFTRIDIPRLFGRDADGVVWTLTDDTWRASRFNMKREADGQEIQTSCAA